MEQVEIKLSQFGFDDAENRKYFVCADGRVVVQKMLGNGIEKSAYKVTAINNGYPAIWIKKGKNGKRTAIYVREMIAIAFYNYDRQDSNQRIINLDFDKKNNTKDNIKVVTEAEWRAHYKPTFSKMLGVDRKDNLPHVKLSVVQVKELKTMLSETKNIPKIAKKFSISIGQVYRIKRGENWSHI